MKVTIAKTAGFCMGVRRAVELALDSANRADGPIYTYGPLIHNPQVLSILEQKGIGVLEQMPEDAEGTVIVRAHGIPPQDRRALEEAGFFVIDATCPRVIKVQSIIAKHARQGYATIIVGDKEHPEVKGLIGYAVEDGHVVNSMEELEALPRFEKAIIVAQTTQNTAFFEKVRQWATRHHPEYRVFNTICDSTEKRQSEVKALADEVDAVIVVGGFNSGNTQRLAEIARHSGKTALHIEKADDLSVAALAECQHIGITAGASTPNWTIRQVFQDIDTRLSQKGRRLRRCGLILIRNLMLSNLYLASGAAALAFAGIWMQGMAIQGSYLGIAALYILSMHTVHHMLDRISDRYNDPERARFYQENRYALTALAVVAGLGGLIIAWEMGFLFFMLLLCMSLLGVVYNAEIDGSGNSIKKASVLKRIPGSKTVLVTLAWGIVAALFPALHHQGYFDLATVTAFLWVGALVFVRTAYFDIIDMQGSRIVGRETIPILLGEKKTLRLLKAILIGNILLLPAAAIAGIIPAAGALLSLCPAAMLAFLYAHEKRGRFLGLLQGFIMETHFVFAGILAMLFRVLGW